MEFYLLKAKPSCLFKLPRANKNTALRQRLKQRLRTATMSVVTHEVTQEIISNGETKCAVSLDKQKIAIVGKSLGGGPGQSKGLMILEVKDFHEVDDSAAAKVSVKISPELNLSTFGNEYIHGMNSLNGRYLALIDPNKQLSVLVLKGSSIEKEETNRILDKTVYLVANKVSVSMGHNGPGFSQVLAFYKDDLLFINSGGQICKLNLRGETEEREEMLNNTNETGGLTISYDYLYFFTKNVIARHDLRYPSKGVRTVMCHSPQKGHKFSLEGQDMILCIQASSTFLYVLTTKGLFNLSLALQSRHPQAQHRCFMTNRTFSYVRPSKLTLVAGSGLDMAVVSLVDGSARCFLPKSAGKLAEICRVRVGEHIGYLSVHHCSPRLLLVASVRNSWKASVIDLN